MKQETYNAWFILSAIAFTSCLLYAMIEAPIQPDGWAAVTYVASGINLLACIIVGLQPSKD